MTQIHPEVGRIRVYIHKSQSRRGLPCENSLSKTWTPWHRYGYFFISCPLSNYNGGHDLSSIITDMIIHHQSERITEPIFCSAYEQPSQISRCGEHFSFRIVIEYEDTES